MKKKILLTAIVSFILALCSVKSSNAQIFWDQACSFPGTNPGHFSVKHASQLNLNSSFTIEMWINPLNSTSPANQNLIQKRDAGSTGYAVLMTNGKISIRTNNTVRVTGNIVIPNNTWTHVAARYNSTNNNFSIYINSMLDAAAAVAGATPVVNSDSLWIGKGSNSLYAGLMDNLRIWNEVLTPSEIQNHYRSIICTNSGKYSGLVLSIPFQPNNSDANDFSLDEKTSYNHVTVNRGVSGYDLSSRPSVTTSLNNAAFFEEGTTDRYIEGESGPGTEPNEHITLEAWVYPKGAVSTGDQFIISNGSAVNDNTPNYALFFNDAGHYICGVINGIKLYSDYIIISSEIWTHIAFVYSANTGRYEFFVNGSSIGVGINNLNNILYSVDDKIFIGNGFDGYVDELRITESAKTEEFIQKFLFQSIDEANMPFAMSSAVYSFDGYLSSTIEGSPNLKFFGTADFSCPATMSDVPVSPLIRRDNFFEEFYLVKSNLRIPNGSATSGSITSYLNIGLNKAITDINVFVALNHTEENSLKLVLFSPDNDSCVLFDHHELAGEADDIITIFDDQADSNVSNSGRYVSIQSSLKPHENLLAAFGGSNARGLWRLKIYDDLIGDIGRLKSFGIQFNNDDHKVYTLYTGTLLQGFYDPENEVTVRDTFKCTIRSASSPFSVIAASKSYCNQYGESTYDFDPLTEFIPSFNNCYIQINHRNSVETWSSGLTEFDHMSNTFGYDFTRSQSAAYGNNLFYFPEPRDYAIYGGDVDQSGAVNLTDITIAYNMASVFQTGYVIGDVTGDNTVNLTDLSLIYNNSSLFIHSVRP